MGNLFSGHFTYYRPPFRRRRSMKRSSRCISIGSSLTRSQSVHANDQTGVSNPASGHRPASSTASVSSDRGQQLAPIGHTNSQVSLKERKPSLKMALKRVYSNASTSPNVFTDERRQLVQASWQEISQRVGKVEFSIRIFENLFRHSPAIRSMFDVPSSSQSGLNELPTFVRHAQVFANVLDLAVRNALDLEAEVGPVLIMFGRRHYNKHKIDFRNHYLTIFAQSISEAINHSLSEDFLGNAEVAVGWRLFISYVVRKVKEGYDLESMQRKK